MFYLFYIFCNKNNINTTTTKQINGKERVNKASEKFMKNTHRYKSIFA